MPNNNQDMLYRFLRMDGNIDAAARTVNISFSSEAPVRRFDWSEYKYYDEILGHDDGNADLVRLRELRVALFNHDRNKVIGAVIEPVLNTAEHRCEAKLRFDTDEFSEMIFQKVKSGTLRGISVGYGINSFEEVADGKKSADGRFIGPCRIARSWTPFEVSVVSIPADTSVGVGRALDDIPESELEEFRQFKAAKELEKEKQRRLTKLQSLARELDLMELEC